MCIRGKTVCPTLKGWKWGYLVFHRKRLEPRVLPWQQLRRCHSLSFVMRIFGAKFEEHSFNISRDIRDWVLYGFSGTIYDVITFLICITQERKYLYNEKRYSKKKPAFFFTLKNLPNRQQLFFYFIGTWSDIISWRFGDFMTSLSRVQMRIELTNASSRVITDLHSGGGYTNTLARIESVCTFKLGVNCLM